MCETCWERDSGLAQLGWRGDGRALELGNGDLKLRARGRSAARVVGEMDWLGLKVSLSQPVVAGQPEVAWVPSPS